jgi:hypothetical protein
MKIVMNVRLNYLHTQENLNGLCSSESFATAVKS